jgi:hypothetical protein
VDVVGEIGDCSNAIRINRTLSSKVIRLAAQLAVTGAFGRFCSIRGKLINSGKRARTSLRRTTRFSRDDHRHWAASAQKEDGNGAI